MSHDARRHRFDHRGRGGSPPLVDLVERSNEDPGAPFEHEALALLRSVARSRPADFERFWARLKTETKVRCAKLEKAMIEDLREGHGGNCMAGRPVKFDEIEPWPEAVNGAELLTELSGAIGAYVVMDAHQRDATALWTVFAHTHDLRDYAPFLIIASPMKRCGKTKLQETLARLVPRPRPTSGVTAPLFARLIEKHRPTLFIDEFDAMARGDKERVESLRGQLNSSFDKRSAVVLKLVAVPGNGWEERQFSTWAPTCVAGIGTVPDTVEDRSVIIRLTRKLRTETVRRLRGKDGGDLAMLARKVARFVNDNERSLRQAQPKSPDALNDRQADAWDPLLAIADAAGGDWPDRARATALTLSGAADAEAAERDIKTVLLMDIRDVFARLFPEGHADHRSKYGPRLSTKRLLEELHGIEERNWGAWGKKAPRPMTDTALAGLLRNYRIRSGTVRVEDGAFITAKGYYLRSFAGAFSRYLPSSGPSSRHADTSVEKQDKTLSFADVTGGFCDGSENAGNSSNSGRCVVVTAQREGERAETENNDPDARTESVPSPDYRASEIHSKQASPRRRRTIL
jgi:hypothetical protein